MTPIFVLESISWAVAEFSFEFMLTTALFAIADLIKYIDSSYPHPSNESLIKEWETRDLQT
jgi:hypothetical protein